MLFLLLCALAGAIEMPCNPGADSACVAHNSALSAPVFEALSSPPTYFQASAGAPQIAFDGEGARLGIFNRFDNPQLTSNEYILYGKVEADIKGSAGTGIISLLYLQSDDLDEIDIAEMFGSNSAMYQTNFFIKGVTGNYDRGTDVEMALLPHTEFHRYGVEWTPREILWLLDGAVVRRLARDNPHGFPTSPMRVMASCWAGGDHGNSPGTIEWAGGLTNYKLLPFLMHVRNLRVENYLDGQEYVYGQKQRLTVVTGRGLLGRKKYGEPKARGMQYTSGQGRTSNLATWAAWGAAMAAAV